MTGKVARLAPMSPTPSGAASQMPLHQLTNRRGFRQLLRQVGQAFQPDAARRRLARTPIPPPCQAEKPDLRGASLCNRHGATGVGMVAPAVDVLLAGEEFIVAAFELRIELRIEAVGER